jgi:anti-repressor protein
MKELIKITEHNGKKAVSARELYLVLTENKDNVTRWMTSNITANTFAIEGIDYQRIMHVAENGRAIEDYALSIDFCKELCMLSQCEKGKHARLYFIEMEKVALKPMELSKKDLALMVIESENARELAESKILELTPKAEYHDKVLRSETAITTTVIAKELGMSAEALNKKLHALGIQFKTNGTWILYAKYQNIDYTKTKTATFEDSKGAQQSHIQTYWTEKGRQFIHSEVKGSYVYSHN